jgi:purine-binding chemotaxis protein CheW
MSDIVAGADGQQHQHLTFNAGGELFAIAILSVREIIEVGHITVVPMMPEVVRGVINLRGTVVPVVDLASRLGRGRTPLQGRSCVIIVELDNDADNEVDNDAGRQVIGILVDSVTEVIEMTPDQIEPAPTLGSRLRTDFIAGIGKVGVRFVIILDLSRTFDFQDLEREVLRSASAGQAVSA